MIREYRDMPPAFFVGIGLAVAGIGIGVGLGIFGIAGCEARSTEAMRKSEIRKNELNAEFRTILLNAKREGMNVEEFLNEINGQNPIADWVKRALEEKP